MTFHDVGVYGDSSGAVIAAVSAKCEGTLSGKIYRGRMFINANYVGDLMAAAGLKHTVGRVLATHGEKAPAIIRLRPASGG